MFFDRGDLMTDRDEGQPAQAPDDGDDGSPRTAPADGPGVMEQEPSVREAIDDDTGAAVFTVHDAEDRGPLAPDFREPTQDAE